jgi:Tol biopolymer transport system component
MLRGLLLLGATLLFVGLGGASSHVRNGRIAFEHITKSNHTEIYSMTAHGTNRHLLTPTRWAAGRSPGYSPRGRRIVYVSGYNPSDLWTMHSDGSHRRPLTHTTQIDETGPDWSPDGKEIAFAATGRGGAGIFVIGIDGRDRRQLTNGGDTDPSWSPDGSEIAFDRYDAATQTFGIWVVPAGGGTPRDLSSDPGISDLEPDWSPDGTRILFASDRPDTSQLDLWTMNAAGGDLRRVTSTPARYERGPVWSPDGRWIVYAAEGSSAGGWRYTLYGSQLYVSRADGSGRRKITHACGGCMIANYQPSWQPLP